ncbi:MAG: tetratricopeptide repeat protein [Candidatus Omnitrophota bacterium]
MKKINLFLFFLLLVILLEISLRLGGIIFLYLQESSNRKAMQQQGAYRILCLGESTTACGGNNSYPAQLERILNHANSGVTFSVINKGVVGTNSTAIILSLEDNLNKYNPQMVVAMMGINDQGNYLIDKPPVSLNSLSSFFYSLKITKLIRLTWRAIINEREKKGHTFIPRQGQSFEKLTESQASQSIDKSININTAGNYHRYVALGTFCIIQGNLLQAEKSFREAITLQPDSDEAYIGLGRACAMQLKYKEAEEYFKKALEINHSNDQLLVETGWFFMEQKKYTEAEEALLRAVQINPLNEKACIELARLYINQSEFKRAEECLNKAIKINPHSNAAYATMGVLNNQRGDFSQAKKYLEKANSAMQHYDYSQFRLNYRKLKDILDKRGVVLVCVQYPMRSILPLKEMLSEYQGIIFVDNEMIFKDSIKTGGYAKYFVDMFGGDFGHCTLEGYKLLASNIARVILKKYFSKGINEPA